MTIIEHLSGPLRGRDGRFPAMVLAIGDWLATSLWFGVAQCFVLFPPLVGALWLLCWVGIFCRRYVIRGSRFGTRRQIPVSTSTPRVGLGPIFLVVFGSVTLLTVIGHLYRALPWISDLSDATWAAYESTPAGAVVVAFMLVAVAPLFEEVGYRGWILDVIRSRYGVTPAVLVSSIAFGVGHRGLEWLPFYVVAGVLLCLVVLTTGSIWTAVAVHAAHNLAQPLFDAGIPTPAVLVMAAIGGMGVTIILLTVLRRLSRAVSIDAAPAG